MIWVDSALTSFAGWATGKILKGSGYGALADIVIGILGAMVGGFVMRTLGFAGSGGFFYTVCVAVLGAVILVWLEHLFLTEGIAEAIAE